MSKEENHCSSVEETYASSADRIVSRVLSKRRIIHLLPIFGLPRPLPFFSTHSNIIYGLVGRAQMVTWKVWPGGRLGLPMAWGELFGIEVPID